jgi:hypothetical protein
MRTSIAVATTIMVVCVQGTAFGQCTYDTCALRTTHGWSVRLVAGAEEKEIAKLGMFPPAEPTALFAERSDVAASLYDSFRSQRRKGSFMVIGGLAVMLGGVFVASENEGVAWGLIVGGLGIEIGGAIVQVVAFDKVSRAVWEYNRTLSR